jgi:hypothetical protein
MARSFEDALSVKADTIEKPPLPPTGTYTFNITKVPEHKTSDDEAWDFVNIPVQAISAGPDVDEDELERFGGVKALFLRVSFIFNREDDANFDRTLYNLKRFILEHAKVEVAEDASMKEMLASCVHHQFMGSVRYRANKKNPEELFAEIGKTAPVE